MGGAGFERIVEICGRHGTRVGCLVISPYSKRGISKAFHSHVSLVKFCEVTFGLNPVKARDAASDDMSDCFDFKQNPLPPIELGIWNRGNGSAAAGGNHCSSAGQIVRLATLASHGSPDNSPRLSMAAKAGPAHGVQPKAKASPSKKERSLPCRISR